MNDAQAVEHVKAILRTRELLTVEARSIAFGLLSIGAVTAEAVRTELISAMDGASPRPRLIPWSVGDAEARAIASDVVVDVLAELMGGAR